MTRSRHDVIWTFKIINCRWLESNLSNLSSAWDTEVCWTKAASVSPSPGSRPFPYAFSVWFSPEVLAFASVLTSGIEPISSSLSLSLSSESESEFVLVLVLMFVSACTAFLNSFASHQSSASIMSSAGVLDLFLELQESFSFASSIPLDAELPEDDDYDDDDDDYDDEDETLTFLFRLLLLPFWILPRPLPVPLLLPVPLPLPLPLFLPLFLSLPPRELYLRRFRLLLLSLSEELELDALALLLLEDEEDLESLPKFDSFLRSIECKFLFRHVSWSGISMHVSGHHFGIAHYWFCLRSSRYGRCNSHACCCIDHAYHDANYFGINSNGDRCRLCPKFGPYLHHNTAVMTIILLPISIVSCIVSAHVPIPVPFPFPSTTTRSLPVKPAILNSIVIAVIVISVVATVAVFMIAINALIIPIFNLYTVENRNWSRLIGP